MADYNAEIQKKADGTYSADIVPRITVRGTDDKVMVEEAIAKFLEHPGIKSGDKLIHVVNGEKVVLAVKP